MKKFIINYSFILLMVLVISCIGCAATRQLADAATDIVLSDKTIEVDKNEKVSLSQVEFRKGGHIKINEVETSTYGEHVFEKDIYVLNIDDEVEFGEFIKRAEIDFAKVTETYLYFKQKRIDEEAAAAIADSLDDD